MQIKLPCYSIMVDLGPEDPKRPGTYKGGTISSLLDAFPFCEAEGEPQDELSAALTTIEKMVLAHACAGVDITTPAYIEGIETTVDAVEHLFG